MNLAYLDPASGSMLVGAIVAGFAGAAVTLRVWWRRVVNKVRRKPVGAQAAPVKASGQARAAREQES